MSGSDDRLAALLALAGITSLVVLLGMAVYDCNEQSKCRDSGGEVERYNFRTEYIPMSCGSGCTMIVPTEVSDWRCKGAAR